MYMDYRLFARHFTVMNFRIFLIILPGTHFQRIQELRPFLPSLYKQTMQASQSPFYTLLCHWLCCLAIICVHISTTTVKLPEKQAHFLKPLSSTLTQGMAYKRLNTFIWGLQKQESIAQCLLAAPTLQLLEIQKWSQELAGWGREVSQLPWWKGLGV